MDAIFITPLLGISDHRNFLARAIDQIERDLLDALLQAQKRREMGLEGDLAAEAQEVAKGLADQFILTRAQPVCQREVRQRLGDNAGGATEDFLSTLAAIAAARDPEMRIDALSYRNRAMNLQLVAPDLTTIDTFSRELEGTRRFEVVLEANNPVDGGTEGRLRIAGANP